MAQSFSSDVRIGMSRRRVARGGIFRKSNVLNDVIVAACFVTLAAAVAMLLHAFGPAP